MESALIHVLHSSIITVILYVIMRFGLKQSQNMAENRSILVGAIALIYMILFGHSLPYHLNKI
jgi:hypothetical protein